MAGFISKNGTLARDTSVIAWGTQITLPAGTRVRTAEQGTGLGYFWAVADVPLLIQLTRNTHDPVYRYCEVPADAVTLIPMAEGEIERQVERMTDSVDRRYMTSDMPADEYAAELRRIDTWARDALTKRGN